MNKAHDNLDNFQQADQERAKSDGSHMDEATSNTCPDGGLSEMSLSFLEIPKANSAGDNELREGNTESVTPDQSKEVISHHKQ